MTNKIIKIVNYTVLLYIGVFSLIWLLSSQIINYYLADYLTQHQLVLSKQTSIHYNPFISHLEVRKLSLTKAQAPGHKVFTIDKLDLRLDLYRLFSNQIFVSEFILDGLTLAVAKQGNAITVAGVVLPQSAAPEQQSQVHKPPQPPLPSPLMPYQLVMPELRVQNAQLDLALPLSAHQLQLDSFVLSEFAATLAAQQLTLLIDAKLDQAPLTLNINADLANKLGKVVVDVKLSQLDLARFQHFLPDTVTQLGGRVSYNGNHTIMLQQQGISIELAQVSLNTEQLAISQDNIALTLAKQTLLSDKLSLLLKPDANISITGGAELALSGFKASSGTQQQILAAFEQANFSNIALTYNGETHNEKTNHLSFADIEITSAVLSDDLDNELAALGTFSRLHLAQTRLSSTGVDIAGISLAGLALEAQLGQQQQLLNLVEFTSGNAEQAPPADAPETDEPQQTEFAVALGQFNLVGPAAILFIDHSVKPAYQRKVTLTKLSLGPLAFASEGEAEVKPTLFFLTGKSNQYAHFDFSGSATPFAPKPDYQLTGFLKEVSLPGISSYIKQALDYEIQSGQLDIDLDLALNGAQIKGNADVLLRGIELTSANDHQSDSIKDQAMIPFNMALGMLKDGDGNVELNLPLSGDTSNPQFGLSGFISLLVKQATMSAAKTYLMNTLVPYASVVNVALAAGEFALKVRFNDLHYAPTEVLLQPDHQGFLGEFAALMREKPEIQVKLCAAATAADIGLSADATITQAIDIEKLSAISQQRVDLFKQHMVQIEKIDSSRLLLCTPQINAAADAIPAISFVR
jgi:hypothetical protein